jgi:hypothetical protein
MRPQSLSAALPAGHDPRQPVDQLLPDLATSLDGLSTTEARRRLAEYGPNELRRHGGPAGGGSSSGN